MAACVNKYDYSIKPLTQGVEEKMKNLFVLAIAVGFLFGCASVSPPPSASAPEIQRLENKFFEAAITPMRAWTGSGCYDSLELTVTNKTNMNLEVIWDQTLFISDGRTNGTFWFEGLMYKEKNTPQQPDIIPAEQRIVKVIFPNNLMYFTGHFGIDGRFIPETRHGCLPAGAVGVFVTVKAGEQQIGDRLTVTIGK